MLMMIHVYDLNAYAWLVSISSQILNRHGEGNMVMDGGDNPVKLAKFSNHSPQEVRAHY